MFVCLPGLPVPVVWTRLAHTANAGEWTLIVQEAVTWKAGESIVIASTGHRYLAMLIYLRYIFFLICVKDERFGIHPNYFILT